MADVLSKEQRQKCMSHIKSKNTKPEVLVRRFLFANGYRFRLYRKDLPGKPDIVLPKYKTVIFINGCFWHGHSGCKYATIPETNREFWSNKIFGNVERDKVTFSSLEKMGWRVIVIWQCELKPKTKDQTLQNLISTLKNGQR
ncbi:MAG: very short patch repair endonuclease [Muribaculaceae bacterium]